MLRKIPTDSLRVGMHVHEVCGSWLEHPFWRGSFKVTEEAQIGQLGAIREHDVHEHHARLDRVRDAQRLVPIGRVHVRPESVRDVVREADRPLFPEPAAMRLDEGVEPLADSLARAERKALLAALVACGGNRRLAASRLGISRAGLYAKLQQHGIER